MNAAFDTARRLRAAGLRVTRPRVAVYEALRELGGHHSVDALTTVLGGRGEDVSRMSVYNVVGDLHAAGLVMLADVGPGRAVYEVADEWHHHFVCRQCDTITDVPCTVGRKPCLHPKLDRVDIDEAQVIFRGLCERCAKKKKSRG